jgi:hypothetical protein
LEGSLHSLKIIITFLDMLCMPAVGFESLEDVLGESTSGVTIYATVRMIGFEQSVKNLTNGNVVVIIDHDKVTKL